MHIIAPHCTTLHHIAPHCTTLHHSFIRFLFFVLPFLPKRVDLIRFQADRQRRHSKLPDRASGLSGGLCGEKLVTHPSPKMEMIWRYMMIYDDIWQFLLVKKEGGSHLFGSGMAFFPFEGNGCTGRKKKLGQGTEIKRAVGVGIECLGVACHLSTFCEDLRRWLAARKQ